ncbi:S-adenosyl-L-methionine-dependent methyltransferase [Xylariaceae sp. AK1471]|nr:S-adenosyl-L-methionine-dependent methyltransferase [Xylariaceae sp. AK1471]
MVNDSLYILNESDKDGIEQEKKRLDIQHYWIDDMMKNEPLPRHIADQLEANPSPRVCDVATGTGIWLKELAKTLPTSAELVGLDYDPPKFPEPEELPSNVKLSFTNVFEPFSEELQNRFDVVHLRFFVYAMKKGQGVPLVQNLLSLLRPGGWLVWVDLSPSMFTVEPPDQAVWEFQKAYYDFAKKVDLDVDVPLALTSYFEQAGLVDCDDRVYHSNSRLFGPKGGPAWSAREQEAGFIGMKQVLKGIFLTGGVEGLRTQQEVDELTARLREVLTGTRKFHFPISRRSGR